MASLSLSEFADKVSDNMRFISREFFKHQPGSFYKTRITVPQFMVLEILNRSGESRMTDLARFMNITTAAMTGIVERLVRDKYVVRTSDPNDRRIIRVRPTAKGSRIVKDMIENRKRLVMKIFGVISEKEREEYLKILMHIREHLK
jgi:DNA-binding MarR family transcriptional regulator